MWEIEVKFCMWLKNFFEVQNILDIKLIFNEIYFLYICFFFLNIWNKEFCLI